MSRLNVITLLFAAGPPTRADIEEDDPPEAGSPGAEPFGADTPPSSF